MYIIWGLGAHPEVPKASRPPPGSSRPGGYLLDPEFCRFLLSLIFTTKSFAFGVSVLDGHICSTLGV